jgi:DNA-binding response OmpR family regulator
MARSAEPMRTDARSRALVVDADPGRVGAIVHALGEAGIEADTAYRGSVALARVSTDPADIAIVGDGLGDLPATELIPRLIGRARIPILAVSSRPDEASVVALLDAGADDVIGAASRPLELVARVRILLRRGQAVPPIPAAPLPDGLRVDIGRQVASVFGRSLGLTPTELEVLAVIASRRGDVVDHRTLLRAVWPDRPDADADLLRAHLTHLNAKLVALGHPGLRNVRSAGYGLRVAGTYILG